MLLVLNERTFIMFTALSIAGSDSCGGAGIQADIKTMSAHGIYAMTAITALTAQNTTGVTDISEVSPVFLAKQLDAIFTDIFPDAVKIGMLSNSEIMKVVLDKLVFYKAKNIVLDPVMVSTSGSRLMKEEASDYLINELFPVADIITPNIPEAEAISGGTIENAKDMQAAAMEIYNSIIEKKRCKSKEEGIYSKDTAVLLKGGHSICDANDLLILDGKQYWIQGERIDNDNTHGTGCTLSSAIASNLAAGENMYDSVVKAKKYISGALSAGLNLGKGSGPLNHMYKITNT